MSEFWKGVFSDGGEPSFSRVATGFLLFFACGWVTAIVFRYYQLPDFMGLVAFIGVLYGLNKAPALASAIRKDGTSNDAK